jgi:uncharacterized GH25 family protein
MMLSAVSLFLLAVPLQAHFLFLVPEADGQSVLLIFSDALEPDRPELMAKVTGTKVQFRPVNGAATDLKWTDQKDAFLLTAPKGQSGLVSASLKYGVVAKGEQPFLLHYYAAAWLPGAGKQAPPALNPNEQALQIVPLGGRKFQAVWQGKPVAEAAVAIVGGERGQEIKADAQGVVELPANAPPLVGLRVRQVEAKAGEQDGKAYQEVRHYATLVVRLK